MKLKSLKQHFRAEHWSLYLDQCRHLRWHQPSPKTGKRGHSCRALSLTQCLSRLRESEVHRNPESEISVPTFTRWCSVRWINSSSIPWLWEADLTPHLLCRECRLGSTVYLSQRGQARAVTELLLGGVWFSLRTRPCCSVIHPAPHSANKAPHSFSRTPKSYTWTPGSWI